MKVFAFLRECGANSPDNAASSAVVEHATGVGRNTVARYANAPEDTGIEKHRKYGRFTRYLVNAFTGEQVPPPYNEPELIQRRNSIIAEKNREYGLDLDPRKLANQFGPHIGKLTENEDKFTEQESEFMVYAREISPPNMFHVEDGYEVTFSFEDVVGDPRARKHIKARASDLKTRFFALFHRGFLRDFHPRIGGAALGVIKDGIDRDKSYFKGLIYPNDYERDVGLFVEKIDEVVTSGGRDFQYGVPISQAEMREAWKRYEAER